MQINGDASARPSRVRMFLEADTALELVRLQLQTNTALMGQADFTDIQYVKGKWYAWYLLDVDEHPEMLKGIYAVSGP